MITFREFSLPLRPRRKGFTLVEMLVALAIFLLLLTITMVPLRLAFDSLNAGRGRAALQADAQQAVSQMERDISRALFIYPNARLTGVTQQKPYYDPSPSATPSGGPYQGLPYTLSTTETGTPVARGVCEVDGTTTIPWSNPGRIDLILPLTTNGIVSTPVKPAYYMVTYYARRSRMDVPFDDLTNPMMLFRAQYPYLYKDGSRANEAMNSYSPGESLNADVTAARFPSSLPCSSPTQQDRGALWMAHDKYGEADLYSLCRDAPNNTADPARVASSHTRALPLDLSLRLPSSKQNPRPDRTVQGGLQPETTFVCADTNGDGLIDSVTIKLVAQNYSPSGISSTNGQPGSQVIRYSRTVDAPNVRQLPGIR